MTSKKEKREEKEAKVPVETAPIPGPVTTEGGKKVVVVNEWGDVGTVPVEHVRSGAYREAGLTLATPEQTREKQLEEKYGDTGSAIRAAAEGGLRGVTLGASDWAMRELGVDAEGLRERRRLNPLAAGIGETAGIVAPALVPGGGLAMLLGRGAGTAARVAGGARAALRATPAGIVASAGRAVEGGLAARLGGGALARTGAAATVGAGEGAIYGIGQAVSEAALGDYELTAEQLMSSMKTGAIFGGVTGGLLTGAGPAVGAVAKRAGALAKRAGAVVELTPALLNKSLTRQSIDNFISETAFQAAKGPGGGKKFVDKAKRQFGKDYQAQIGKVIRDEGLFTWTSTIDDIANNAVISKNKWGKQIDTVLTQLDEITEETYKPTIKKISDRIDNEVLNKLKGSQLPDLQRMGRRVEKSLSPFLIRATPDVRVAFKDLHNMRAELDDLVYRTDKASPVIEELRNARSVIEDELTIAADKAADVVGGGLATSYKEAKHKYAALSRVTEMAEDAASRLDTNRNFSMSDMQVAQIPALAGMAEWAASGDLDLSTLATAFIAGRVHRMIRTRGATALAAGMDRASKAAQIQALKQSADDITTTVQTAVKKMTVAEPVRAKARQIIVPSIVTEQEQKPETLRERFDNKVKLHNEIINSPQVLQNRIINTMGNAGQVAPNTMAAMTAKTVQAATFLRDKMPVPPLRSSDVTAHLQTRQRVPDSYMAKYLRYAEVVEDPRVAIEQMGAGKLSREGAEALRTVYPAMYADIEKAIITRLIEAKDPLPTDKLLHLSILLDRPLHPSFEPTYVAEVQKMYKKEREDKKSPQARKVPDMAGNYASRSHQLV